VFIRVHLWFRLGFFAPCTPSLKIQLDPSPVARHNGASCGTLNGADGRGGWIVTYELRPLSFGELLDTGFRIFRNHFGLLFGLAAVVYLPVALIQLIAQTLTPLAPGVEPAGSTAVLLVFAASLIALGLFVMLTWPIADAAITHAVGELYLGRPAAFGPSLRVGLSILVPMVGTSLLNMLIVMGALLLFIIPGIYFMFAYMLVWQVMVIERLFGMQALRRSGSLMKGSKLRGLGVMIVYLLVISVPSSLLSLALHAYPTVASLASVLVQTAGFAFLCTLSVVLYFDIRCRKEAFDLEHLADLVEQRAAVPAPA
jgi:hypothetical protein